jgi:hypothetical protein
MAAASSELTDAALECVISTQREKEHVMWDRYDLPSRDTGKIERQTYDWRSEFIAIIVIVVIVAAFVFVGGVWLRQQ